MTSWDFYSKFLHYNLFVYEEMYDKINHMVYQRVEELESMCEKIERYAEKREIIMYITAYLENSASKETIIDRTMKKFNITEEDAEEYYAEVFQQ
ncbi:Uncharacterised protein [Coprococcus eutactus]|mgnify:CR=1 FL=1|nr:Uncharacterised protein [Coprococcus eutactus]